MGLARLLPADLDGGLHNRLHLRQPVPLTPSAKGAGGFDAPSANGSSPWRPPPMPDRIVLPTGSLRRVPIRKRDISTSQSAMEHVLALRPAAHGHLNLYRWRWDHLDADASDGRRALAAVGHGRRAELSPSLPCLGTAAFALADQSEAPSVLVPGRRSRSQRASRPCRWPTTRRASSLTARLGFCRITPPVANLLWTRSSLIT